MDDVSDTNQIWRMLFSEFLGTAILLFLGCGSIMWVGTVNPAAVIQIALTFGLTIATLVQVNIPHRDDLKLISKRTTLIVRNCRNPMYAHWTSQKKEKKTNETTGNDNAKWYLHKCCRLFLHSGNQKINSMYYSINAAQLHCTRINYRRHNFYTSQAYNHNIMTGVLYNFANVNRFFFFFAQSNEPDRISFITARDHTFRQFYAW